MTEVRHKAMPRQHDFLTSKAREVLYSGAYGAGKTRAVCLKLIARASVPGAREGLCRKNLVSLRATTLKTLLEPDGLLPPVLPAGSYTHRKVDRTINIHGGGEIVYFGLGDADDYQKIGSLNLSGCAVDEAVELTEQDWTMLRGRIRLSVGIPNQIYGACNPGPPSHFLAQRFGLAMDYVAEANCEAFTTTTMDNKHLPAEYIADLDTLTGVAHKRYVLGQWVGSDGLVYDRWDRSVFVMDRDRSEFKRFIVGQDAGYTNPAVMLVIGLDEDDRMHIVEEWYEKGQQEEAVVAQACRFREEYGISEYVIDPSAAGLTAALRASGLFVRPAENAVFDGIQRVQSRLSVAGDGRPRLTVSPSCVNVIREFETYEWKTQTRSSAFLKDEPKKEHDHAMDALRYAVARVDGIKPQPRMRSIGTDAKPRRRRERSREHCSWTEV